MEPEPGQSDGSGSSQIPRLQPNTPAPAAPAPKGFGSKNPATDSDSAGETDRQLKIEERQTDSNSVGETDRRLG